ncbi:MAG: hypothetical protein J1F60_03925 [Oscillospiraceae bacterium]|nr:hypothetical protein [Oscillospiraceae bacterium]
MSKTTSLNIVQSKIRKICKINCQSERGANVAVSHDKATHPMTMIQTPHNEIAEEALIYGMITV